MKPKLTLRDLFWLVLVCAIGCGWLLHWARTEELGYYKMRLIWLERKLESNGYEIEGAVVVDSDGRILR